MVTGEKVGEAEPLSVISPLWELQIVEHQPLPGPQNHPKAATICLSLGVAGARFVSGPFFPLGIVFRYGVSSGSLKSS